MENTKIELLIVDDNPENLKVLSKMLKSEGYRVRVAKNGIKALSSIESAEPDLILLDVHMPEMNGFELCRVIRKNIPSAFIYALSGNAELFRPYEDCGAGFDKYFAKPVSLKTLYKIAKDSFEKLQQSTNNPSP